MRKILAFSLLLAPPFTAMAAPETGTAEKKAVKKTVVVKIAPKSTVKVTVPTVGPVKVTPAAPATGAARAPATQPAAAPLPPVKPATSASDVAVPGEPKDAGEALAAAQKAVEYVKVRNWFGLSSICILILIWVLKAAGLFTRIGKRWLYVILPVLGVASMLLAKFTDGLSWESALVVFTSAPSMGLLSDFIKRGVLGKEYDTPINVAKDPLPPTKGSIG
jgi:hypothetical protein